jgi:hypothetical protein
VNTNTAPGMGRQSAVVLSLRGHQSKRKSAPFGQTG